jgi:tRNA (guanine-N7-)-methyltransferase
MMNKTDNQRVIRSFVRREGRITEAQKQALQSLWPHYGVANVGGMINLKELFGRFADTVLEIGFGNGESLLTMAQNHPELNFIGIDVHRPGIGSLLLGCQKYGLNNVRVFCHDAVEILQERIPSASLAAIQLFFPDPWPKKRHHKRRLVKPELMALIGEKLKVGGRFLLATDWEDYAMQMMSVLSSVEGFVNPEGLGKFATRPAERPITKFEQRGLRLGHRVWDLIFVWRPGSERLHHHQNHNDE